MINIHHAVELPYPQHAMYDIVNDVTFYPEFIPFCTVGEVQPISENKIEGALTFAWLGIVRSFVTHNTVNPPYSIQIDLVEGPFKHLEGNWKFIDLPNEHTRVEFSLKFEFERSNSWFDSMLQPVFNTLSYNTMHVFIKRANDRYSKTDTKVDC